MDYATWLARTHTRRSVATRLSQLRAVERAYGSLLSAYATRQILSVLRDLTYSAADARSGRPNPSQIAVRGDLYIALSGYRSTVRSYLRYLDHRRRGTLTARPPLAAARHPAPAPAEQPRRPNPATIAARPHRATA